MAKAKRARAADAKRVAAPREVDPPEDDATSSDSGTDADDAPPPPRPAKRLKEAAARGGGGAAAAAAEGGEAAAGSPHWRNKEKPLVLCSRGIPGRHRHLMLDLVQLLPHCKKDVKLDTKDEREVINEVAELNGCTSALFFESRKHKDLYLWAAKTPAGPTVKFHVTNVHTMGELKLMGNHLKGSRPALHFDASFEASPHSRVVAELLRQVFVTPRGHRKSKPFLDHVLGFYWLDGRVWLRNFQAHWPEGKAGLKEAPTLVEVGPRMTLNPIRIFGGAFRGAVLWSNPDYVSPNAVRRHARAREGGAYASKVRTKQRRKVHAATWQPRGDEMDNERVFK